MSRVGFYRELYKSMSVDNDFYKPTGVRGFRHACGHIRFNDGQHHTCIAKKMKIKELCFDELEDRNSLCPPCKSKHIHIEKKPSFGKYFKKTKKPDALEGPIYITDDKL